MIVEEAGGKCLPCVVDIRYEDQVSKAVEQASQKFGGIDILVNNASAISLTGTLATDMKRYVCTSTTWHLCVQTVLFLIILCVTSSTFFTVIPGLAL